MISGKSYDYHWLVSQEFIPGLVQTIVKTHSNFHLCIVAADGGPTYPNDRELERGWTRQDDVMVSPPLTSSLEIPSEGFDEWYILQNPTLNEQKFERFVNICEFTLELPEALDQDQHPTWERNAFDFLRPIQESFWSQLIKVAPETYISIGDNTIIVSRRREYIDLVVKLWNQVYAQPNK